ncbi:hypothetical protein IWX90DRAFT_422583 [Phyllosticta citrichinensis]|uniref:Uncharacterized protein n=1 Tax=Phyllosticta citrichinensis TaxID=1130410 RepID=A0ABR1Y8B0_9PEZI
MTNSTPPHHHPTSGGPANPIPAPVDHATLPLPRERQEHSTASQWPSDAFPRLVRAARASGSRGEAGIGATKTCGPRVRWTEWWSMWWRDVRQSAVISRNRQQKKRPGDTPTPTLEQVGSISAPRPPPHTPHPTIQSTLQPLPKPSAHITTIDGQVNHPLIPILPSQAMTINISSRHAHIRQHLVRRPPPNHLPACSEPSLG